MTREELLELSNLQPASKLAAAAKRSVELRGVPYYAPLRRAFPHHWQSFRCMHKRGTPNAFPKNISGFIDFIIYLGPVPSYMKKPSIGRIDHSKGYFPGNFEWQESRENSREVALRCKNLDGWILYCE